MMSPEDRETQDRLVDIVADRVKREILDPMSQEIRSLKAQNRSLQGQINTLIDGHLPCA